MYFELQLSADVFTRIVRNRMKSVPLCVDQEFRDPNLNLTLVVDRIIVGENTSIQRERRVNSASATEILEDASTQIVWIFSPTNFSPITVPYLQVRQDVAIYLVKSSDLDANGANPSPAFQSLVIYPVFNVHLSTAKSGAQGGGPLTLAYSLAYVEFGIWYDLLSKQQRDEITMLLGGVKLPPMTVDLGQLTGLMDRPVNAINAGITCDPGGTFVALRADIDVYASPVALGTEFFTAGPQDLLDSKDWAMLLDADLLTQDAARKANDMLKSSSKVRLDSAPVAVWDAGATAVAISSSVELVDACTTFVDNIDMDVDVDIRAAFSVSPVNTLRTRYEIKGEPSDIGEEILCAITGAFLWPFIGPLMLKDTDAGEGFGIYMAGLAVGPVGVFFGILGYIESQQYDPNKNDFGANCQKVGDDIECTKTVDIPMVLIPPFTSRLDLEVARGVPQGLVLAGTIVNLGNTPVGSSEVTATQFGWTLIGSCRPIGAPGFAIANRAQINVTAVFQKGYPVQDVSFCKAYILKNSDPHGEFELVQAPGMVTVIPKFTPQYLAAPYPCRIRLVMSRGRGVRTITLQPPKALADAERQHLEKLRANFKNVCLKWADTFRKREWVDFEIPGPVEKESILFWQIVARGMNREDIVRVERSQAAGDDNPLLSARPSASGLTHITLMLSGRDAPKGLALELVGPRQSGDRAREMSVHQSLFQRRATLPARGALRTLRFERDAHRRRLIIGDAEREITWDVSMPSAPVLLSTMARQKDKNSNDIIVHTGKRVGAEPSRNLRHALKLLSDRLGRIETVGTLRVAGIEETLYVRTEKGATLFDISYPGEPRELHNYESPAWLEGVAMGGRNLMAKLDPESGHVALYVSTASYLS